jgi:hypothetical protein
VHRQRVCSVARQERQPGIERDLAVCRYGERQGRPEQRAEPVAAGNEIERMKRRGGQRLF